MLSIAALLPCGPQNTPVSMEHTRASSQNPEPSQRHSIGLKGVREPLSLKSCVVLEPLALCIPTREAGRHLQFPLNKLGNWKSGEICCSRLRSTDSILLQGLGIVIWLPGIFPVELHVGCRPLPSTKNRHLRAGDSQWLRLEFSSQHSWLAHSHL